MENILCACVVRLARVALHAGRTDRLLHQGGDGSIWTAFITNLCGIYDINLVDVLSVLQLSPPPRVVLLWRNGTPGIWIILKNFLSYQTTISLNLEQFNAHHYEDSSFPGKWTRNHQGNTLSFSITQSINQANNQPNMKTNESIIHSFIQLNRPQTINQSTNQWINKSIH